MSIASLERRIYYCPYTEKCTNRVDCRPIPGYGSAHPKFLVIGTNPGERKNIWKRFDKSQKMLQEKYFDECMKYGYGDLLRELTNGVPEFNIPDSVYLTDIVKCPTVKNETPGQLTIRQCRVTYLEETIKLLKPEIIIALGDIAASQVVYLQDQEIKVIPARHPSRYDSKIVANEIKSKLGIAVENDSPRQSLKKTSLRRSFVDMGSLSKGVFEKALNLWLDRQENERPATGSPAYDYFTLTFQRYVESLVLKAGFPGLKVKASVGVGKWAEIPWVGIRNEDITTNFQDGVFVVYVFAPQFKSLYLTIIRGVAKKSLAEIRSEVNVLRQKIPVPDDFSIGIEGRLSPDEPPNSKPYNYKSGILYSKKYDIRQLPDSAIDSDLKAALKSYQKYVASIGH